MILRLPFLGRRKRTDSREPWDLSTALFQWSEHDAWTIGDAVTGSLITGATGSGKTTASGQAMAKALLRHGFGGLVLTTKPDEREHWQQYCKATGREGDLKVFGADKSLRFNFLDYEATRKGEGAGLTENLVNLFSTVLEVGDRGAAGGTGREDEGYWRRASRQLIRNAVDLLVLSRGRVSVPELYRVVISAPTSAAQKRSTDWQTQSLCFQCLAQADKRQKTASEEADLGVVADYFLIEYPELSEKTRSVIVSTFTSTADILMRGLLRDLFCTETNITPETVTDGTILVIDLPVKTFGEVGTFAQVLWKYAFQRSIERRDLARSPRPVFLWADEAQHFITSYDMQFQTTCRSSRVATVYLTQNVSNVYAALGGQEKGRVEAASLFANLNLKLLHANGDPVTNEWAASLIGRSRQFLANGNSSRSMDGGWPFALGIESLTQPGTTSAGFSETWEFEVQPARFTQLRTGGPTNGWAVDGVLFQNGRRFNASGKTWLPVSFKQR
ncbi:MAG: type IV secretory system conjugative DNA transfer family protein [Planctomycetota bacterium]